MHKFIMYATSPLRKIVGLFSISEIIEATPEDLWRNYGELSGIENRTRFMDYFSQKEHGYALKIENVSRLNSPIDPRDFIDDFRPPVSFMYVNGEFEFLESMVS